MRPQDVIEWWRLSRAKVVETLADATPGRKINWWHKEIDQILQNINQILKNGFEDTVENYIQINNMLYEGKDPSFTKKIDFDLSAVQPSLAGPKRPQRINCCFGRIDK